MIKSFRNALTEDIWNGRPVRRMPLELQRQARRKLRMLNNTQQVIDLTSPPGNRLEGLKGDRKGQYSIRINNQWRICFVWKDGNAFNVEIVDYH